MRAEITRRAFDRYRQPAHLVEEWHRCGYRSDAVVGPVLWEQLRFNRRSLAIIDGDARLTAGELLARADRFAGALAAGGVTRGDVVSWQVPNWWEAAVVALGVWRIGAINNPVLTIYREHELAQILGDLEPAAVLAPPTFRGVEHTAMIDSVLADLGQSPRLRASIRGAARGWEPFEDMLSGGSAFDGAQAAVHPGDPCIIAYTSGTTSGAKGVVIDSYALLAETRQMREVWGVTWRDVSFMPAPLAHLTGVTVGITVPLTAGAPVVLMERWDPERGVDLIERERCTISSGTPTFLEEIVRVGEERGIERSSLRQYSVGGAAVPPRLIERADRTGIGAFRCYGMTEHLSTTIANAGLPLEIRRDTDGPIGPGSGVSCVGDDGRALPRGETGEIRVLGPERMMGYVNPVHNEGVLDLEEGWFSTGDVGYVDADGCVRIVGRTKDIINRGGEKFSAREIEDVICLHPAVRQAAVVPAPDARYGEVPAAFVVLATGAEHPGGPALAEFVHGHRLAKQKTPVEWFAVEQLPTTPFGKVKKQELIARLAEHDTSAPAA